jgi:hypothetical protein
MTQTYTQIKVQCEMWVLKLKKSMPLVENVSMKAKAKAKAGNVIFITGI